MTRKIYYSEEGFEWLSKNADKVKLIYRGEGTTMSAGFESTVRYFIAYCDGDKALKHPVALADFPGDIEGKTALKRIKQCINEDFVETDFNAIINIKHLELFRFGNAVNYDGSLVLEFKDGSHKVISECKGQAYYQKSLGELYTRLHEQRSAEALEQ